MNRDLVLRLLDRSHKLVSSARIEDTPVHNLEGDLIGTMHSVMIDKKNGKVSYAVMLLEPQVQDQVRAHPLPWAMLDYDATLGGYRVNLSQDVLAAVPLLTLADDDRLREVLEENYPANVEGAVPLPIDRNDFNAQTI
jgi:hypothetical protein